MAEVLIEVPAELEATLATVRELRTRLDREVKSTGGKNAVGVSPMHVRASMQLTSAMTSLSRESRMWSKRLKELSDTAPLEDRVEAVKRFILELPDGLRAPLIAYLVQEG